MGTSWTVLTVLSFEAIRSMVRKCRAQLWATNLRCRRDQRHALVDVTLVEHGLYSVCSKHTQLPLRHEMRNGRLSEISEEIASQKNLYRPHPTSVDQVQVPRPSKTCPQAK